MASCFSNHFITLLPCRLSNSPDSSNVFQRFVILFSLHLILCSLHLSDILFVVQVTKTTKFKIPRISEFFFNSVTLKKDPKIKFAQSKAIT